MIVDAHAHVGVTWPDEGVRCSVADAIAMMDRCDIARACTSTSRFLRGDLSLGNEVTAEAVRAYPDRLIGFVIASPRAVAQSLDQCDRYLSGAGFGGIKVHRSHTSLEYNHPAYDAIYAKAAEYGVPVLAHTFSPGEVAQLLDAARQHPAVSFIVGHSGGYAWADCLDAIAAVPNAYFDVCTSCADAGRLEAFVAAAGAERVLFGTDLPFLEPAHCLAQVLATDVSAEEQGLILGGNILRLLGARR